MLTIINSANLKSVQIECLRIQKLEALKFKPLQFLNSKCEQVFYKPELHEKITTNEQSLWFGINNIVNI